MPIPSPADRRPVYVDRDEAQRRLTAIEREKSLRSLAWFARYSWPILESTPLHWTPWLQAQCDTLQALFEGHLVASGKGTPAMVERHRAFYRAAGIEPDLGQLLVQDLYVNGFPGSLKSRFAMVIGPAWVWLHDPTFTIAATSGTGDNVSRDSNMMKELVSSAWYRATFEIAWHVGVNRSGAVVDSVGEWHNSAGGYRLSKELFSSWQGVHVDYLAVDDPDDAMKVWGEADRLRARRKVTAIRNRVKDPTRSIRLVVQQRVHPEDVTGWTIKKGTWSPATPESRALPAVLSIPLEFRPSRRCTTPWGWTDPRTEAGQVAHPERYTAAFRAAERLAYGSSGYEGQYNQNPEVIEGGWYKRQHWRWFRLPEDATDPAPRPEGCRPRTGEGADPAFELGRRKDGTLDVDTVAISVDATFGSLSDDASAVGLTACAIAAGRRLVLEDVTAPMTYTQTEEALCLMIVRWAAQAPGRIVEVLVEKKANGAAVVDRIKKMLAEASLKDAAGRLIVPRLILLETEGGKAVRGRAAMPTVEAGLVYLRDGAVWLNEWVGEVSGFPHAARDDRFDALTQMIIHYADHTSAAAESAAYRNMGAALSGLRL